MAKKTEQVFKPDPKPKRKYKKKTERAKLDGDILDLWSLCVRARDHNVCRSTNSDEQLSAHHVIEKTHRWGRYAIENGITLTWKVHCLQKSHPEQFRDKVIEIIGEEEFNRLKKKYMYQKICRRSIPDLIEVKEGLKYLLKNMEGE